MLRNPRPSLLFTGFASESESSSMASGIGTISDTVNIYMSVSDDTVINWGDGSTTNVTSSSVTLYTHTYVSELNPTITITNPSHVIDLEFELGDNFFVDFTNDLNNSIFTNLETFTMTDVSDANWIGDPFETLLGVSLDLGIA